MALERTLSIIKPDAVAKNVIGEIYTRFERAGLKIVEAKMIQLDDELAGGFYAEHKERPFYKDLVADYAESIDANAVHGSDSVESAAREVAYFFGK